MEDVHRYIDHLLSANQIDLKELSRDRLEDLFLGMLSGQISVFQALGRETQQSAIIESQRRMIDSLNEALNAASEALATSMDHEYREHLLVYEDYIRNNFFDDPDCAKHIMMGIYRALANNKELADDAASWWSDAISKGFFETDKVNQEEQEDEEDEELGLSMEDDTEVENDIESEEEEAV